MAEVSEQNWILESYPWITSGFVENIIKNAEQDENVALKSFNVKKAFKNGENFSSQIVTLRVIFHSKIEGSVEKEKDYLMKIAIQTDDLAKIYEECLVYEREIAAYTIVLPAVEECFNAIGLSARIAPRCFMADIEKKMLVFEDLRDNQFESVDRMHGLDMEHLKLSLLTLAKWHAGTAKLLLTNMELFEWFKNKIVYQNAPSVQSFFRNIAKGVSNAARNWPGFEAIAEKLLNIPQRAYDNVYKSYLPQEDGFNVLTHGDMFMNNILFRHDHNGKPIGIRFVDFPLGKHAKPSIDLVCLLYGSAHSSIRQRDREHLIEYYHSELLKYLKLLSFPGKIPTLLDIQLATFRVDLYNALIVLFIVGLRYISKSFDGGFVEAANDDNIDQNDSEKLYSHPKCIEELKYVLDLFNRRGYFDF